MAYAECPQRTVFVRELIWKEMECETAARLSAPGPAAEKPSQRLGGSPRPRPRPRSRPSREAPADARRPQIAEPEELVECVIKARAVEHSGK